jgi:polyisoprenoid-binding protein YceI
MMVANLRGQFGKISGTIDFDPANPARSSVEATIDVTSLTTTNKKRDEHLFGATDLFDISKYPEIVFKSTRVERPGDNRARVTGDLTMHGVTRPVTLDVEYFGPVKGPEDLGGETTIGFAATTSINREDFGITWNVPIENGLLLGKDVQITLDIEADLVE